MYKNGFCLIVFLWPSALMLLNFFKWIQNRIIWNDLQRKNFFNQKTRILHFSIKRYNKKNPSKFLIGDVFLLFLFCFLFCFVVSFFNCLLVLYFFFFPLEWKTSHVLWPPTKLWKEKTEIFSFFFDFFRSKATMLKPPLQFLWRMRSSRRKGWMWLPNLFRRIWSSEFTFLRFSFFLP